jgi:hypothetical protein
VPPKLEAAKLHLKVGRFTLVIRRSFRG